MSATNDSALRCLANSTALLVIAILLPQLFTQLRIGLAHRRLAQLSCDDVVIAAVRDSGRYRVRPAAAAGTAAYTATTTPAPSALTLLISLTCISLTLLTSLAGISLTFTP